MKRIRNFLLEEEFQIKASNTYVNLVNYEEIISFDNHQVILQTKEKTVAIKGENLVVNKLVNEEVLVCGKIEKIELR